MNTLWAKTLEDAGVSDQKIGNYSFCKNIAVEEKKIRALLRETRPHLGLGTIIKLSVNLVKIYEVAFSIIWGKICRKYWSQNRQI